LLAVGCGSALAQPGTVRVPVGETTVVISHPRGFTVVDSSHGDLLAAAEEATPPTNRLLAYFARRSDLRARAQGKAARFDRYFLVQTLRKVEHRSFSAADFAQVRGATKKQQLELLGNLEPRLAELARNLGKRRSDDTGAAVNLGMGDVVPLGIYQDSESFVSFGAISRSRAGASAEDRTVVNITSIVAANGKILFLYTYATVRNPKDIDWARHSSATWTNDVLALNR
jgi:hypothetical protein